MPAPTVVLGHEVLRDFAARLFEAAAVPAEDAALVARVLVWANLRGVDSHGAMRVPGYLRRLADGLANPRPRMAAAVDLPAAAVLEADRALGQVALARATGIAVEKASAAGIGACFVRRTTHMGALGYFVLEAAAEGMAALAVGASRPNMAYPGARAAGAATNPIAIAAPGARRAPLLLDMATATASLGKIAHAREMGEALGEGWALDADGAPTTDPGRAALPAPLGGHKGGGLSLMFECLASLMVANPLVAPHVEDAPGGRRHMQNGLVLAFDIARFTDVGAYAREVDRLADALKTLPPAAGGGGIAAPGERGDRILARRLAEGVPLPEAVWRRIAAAAAALGIAAPDPE